MSIEDDYSVSNDMFEFDEDMSNFCFPCCACIHRKKAQDVDPCKHCGHNDINGK